MKMVIRRYVVFVLLLWWKYDSVFAQNFILPVQFQDNGRLDSLVRERVKDLGDSYYIISLNIAMAHTTLDPQIIEELDKIRKIRYCHEKVIFIIHNYDQIPNGIMKDYLSKSFRLTTEDWMYLDFLVDNDLSSQLISILPRVYYIFNKKIAYMKTIKRYSITDAYLPHHRFLIHPLPDVELKIPDTIRIKTDDNKISPYKPGRLLISTDPESAIFSVNIYTGEFEKGIIGPNYNQTLEYYCKVIAKGDSMLCNYAKNCAKRSNIEKRKRQVFDFSVAYYSGNHIYTYADLQAFHPNPKGSIQIDEEGKIMIEKKGDPILDLWYGIVKIDTNFLIKEFVLSKDKQYPPAESFCIFDSGFYYDESDSSFVSVNSISEPTPPTFNVPLFSKYKKNVSEYVFFKDFPYKLNKKINKYLDIVPGRFFFKKWNGKLIAILHSLGYIFDVEKGAIIDTLEGDGSPLLKEIIPNFLEDTTSVRLNYYVNCMGTIMDDKYLVITYFYKGRLLCEVKDDKMKTIDILDLSRINGFEKFHFSLSTFSKVSLCIQDNSIIFFTIQDNKYIIKKFKFSLTEKCY